jgi:hypothetical protein
MCRNAAAAIFGKARESWWPTPTLPEMCKSIGIATETRKYGETVALWLPIKQCVVFFVYFEAKAIYMRSLHWKYRSLV